ncbi:oligosaccharide flippase family protein [Fulvivirgaceae bacterium BMA10]|uniref:Oligosaccharide flippase family protein n=1 Tax=Splendidivirga corallicola TaxID=3051826 RepID=A0ABT8KIY7_9BACT|nr:oligosaccharide flippase family protein [Fulvivirgaceae bacterium BMA10]
MSLVKKIIENRHFLALATHGFAALFGLVTFMTIARVYDKADFGQWVLYLTGYSFVEMFKEGVISSALVKFLSGTDLPNKKRIVGSSWTLSLIITFSLATLVYLIFLMFPVPIETFGLTLFFKWYPFLSIAILPLNYAAWIFQAEQKFDKILGIRLWSSGFFLSLVLSNLYFRLSVESIVIMHIASNCLISFVVMIKGWSGLSFLSKSNKNDINKLFGFGKYSLGTLIGTNLLKNADTFLISIFLGPVFVALYSVPLRLTELIEMPLRSLVSTALPKLAAASNQNRKKNVEQIFRQYAGILTVLFIPFMVMAFLFAEELVLLAGGEKYLESANIFRIFCIYGLFLSIDRFTGVTLDAINRPKYNLIKVIWMAGANIMGDILVIMLFEELWLVALVTILNVLVGVVMGFRFLKREISVDFFDILRTGWQECYGTYKTYFGTLFTKSKI